MKHKNQTGFATVTVLIAALCIIVIGLTVVGIAQNTDAKKLFTAPIKTTGHINSKVSSSSLSANSQALATANLSSIDFYLEAYFTLQSYYPGTIASSEFTVLANSGNYSGSNPVTAIQKATATPSGVVYDYTTMPAGCTTAAKNCSHFVLNAKDSSGKTIGTPEDSEN